jgi:hypothetical protein
VDFLVQLPWKGNVREIRNLMERLAILVGKDEVTHRDVMEALQMTAGPAALDDAPMPLKQARARFERQYIVERLASCLRPWRGDRYSRSFLGGASERFAGGRRGLEGATPIAGETTAQAGRRALGCALGALPGPQRSLFSLSPPVPVSPFL